jgi:toxin ParE1/3/4
LLEAAEETFNELGDQPLIGAPLELRSPRLAGIRKWRVRGFDNVLIFYLPRTDRVSIPGASRSHR